MENHIPKLTELCQAAIVSLLRKALDNSNNNSACKKQYGRLINDLCRFVPDYLLEPIFTVLISMLEKGLITDVTLLAFLVPNRYFLKINQAKQIRNSIFKQIGLNCPNLVKIDLSDCIQVSNSVIRSILQGCPILEDMILNNCYRITDSAFDFSQSPFHSLVGCLSLEAISLQGCPQITGEIITTLNKNCKNLKYLNLAQCKKVKSPEIHQLFSHNQLRTLNLSYIDDMSDDSFTMLPSIDDNNNNRLIMNNNNYYNNSYSPLQKLNLGKSKITDVSILLMSNLARKLVEIRLQWCSGITDKGIHALVKNCPKLRLIDLRSCLITNESIKHISLLCEELRSLDLSWCLGFNDEGIKTLVSNDRVINHLEHLSLVWCSQITDETVFALSHSSSLKVVELSGSGLTKEGMEELRIKGISVVL